jgi:hypothetical protein
VRCTCLRVVHSRELKSSLKNKNQDWNLSERGEGAQALDPNEAFRFSEWPPALGDRWGSIHSPHLKKSRWGIFHRTSPVDLSRNRQKLSRSRSYTVQVRSYHQTSSVGVSGSWPQTGLVRLTG